MAKISFTKLGLKPNNETKTFEFNDQIIEVKQYLALEEKIELVSRIVNQSIDNNNFYNPIRVKLFTILEVIYAYTNLNFTEKLKSEPLKTYDLLVGTNFFSDFISILPETEWVEIQNQVNTTIENIYKYHNSIMGIMEAITTDYANLELDAKKINASLSNADNLKLLKEVLSKMG